MTAAAPVTPSYLLDTNLLVYCFDQREPTKRERVLEILGRVGRGPSAALPAQGLGEFADVMLYKMKPPLPPGEVHEHLQLCKKTFPSCPLTPAVSLEATRGGVDERSFRYFDARIWAAAKLNQIPVVFSEDFPVGATVEGVTSENPLDEGYDLGTL